MINRPVNQVVETATGNVVGGTHSATTRNLRFIPMRDHPEGCTCAYHDHAPTVCRVPGCGKVCKGRAARGSHEAWVHKRRRRGFTKVLIPDGLGFLQGVLRDPHRAAGLHLGELPKFAQRLSQGIPRNNKAARRRARVALDLAREALQRSPDEPFQIIMSELKVPAALGEVVLQLAIEADIAPKTMLIALMSYGLEALAKELRVTRMAPAPRLVTPQKPDSGRSPLPVAP